MPRRFAMTWFEILVSIVILLGLMFLLYPAFRDQRENARCFQCVNNMRQIGIALRNYHNHFGSFPPAYTVDETGKPLHSWRTLILPYFDSKAIDPKWKEVYAKIRLDEPWDSEYNIQFSKYIEHTPEEERKYHSDPDSGQPFHHNMPSVYGCPNFGSSDETTKTVYKMIVGNNAVGNGHGTSMTEIKRPLDKTVLLVEAALPVPWMSPSDFTEDDFKTAIYANDQEKVSEVYRDAYAYPPKTDPVKRQILGGGHGRQLHILFVDGTVKTYRDWKLPISEIESMSHIR